MGLHWIVPARRATVTPGGATYGEALDAWIEQLTRHRDAMVRWYSPLAIGLRRVHLATHYDEAVAVVERWRARKLARPGAARKAAVRLVSSATDDSVDATLSSVGFEPRLWRGPLRVLLEEQRDRAEASAAQTPGSDAAPAGEPGVAPEPGAAEPPLRREVDHGGPSVIVESPEHEVLNPNARFLPGDVLEFPVFRLWEHAGLRVFEGAHFRAEGSFLLGDAVALPEGGGLHDNLVAMRFQLIHHAARGAYYSLDPVWQPDSRPAKTCNRSGRRTLGHGREVWGRGLIYASSLGPPNPKGVYDRFWIDLREWCALDRVERRSHAPNAEAMQALPPDMPITLGWTCVTCTLATFYVLMNHVGRGWSPGGGMGRQGRRPDLADHPVSRVITTYLHFDRKFSGKNLPAAKSKGQGRGRRWIVTPEQAAEQHREVARLMTARAGGDRAAIVAAYRADLEAQLADIDRALLEAKGARARRTLQRQRASVVRRRDASSLEHRAVGRWLQDYGLGRLLGDPSAVDRADGPDDEPLDEDVEDEDTDLEVVGAQSPQERSPIDQAWARLDDGREVQVPASALDQVFGAMNFITLSGHEYAYIKIFPHRAMLDEPATEDGPPRVGPLAVYNPLTGEPYEAAETGTLYVHEATGSLANSEWIKKHDRRYYAKMNGSRPARWVALDGVFLRREANGAVHIGETSNGRSVSGYRSRKTRTKSLDSILVVSEEEIREVYAQPSRDGYVPLVLDDRRREDPRRFYDIRAVPYATMHEAAEYPCHDTWDNTHRELRRKKTVLAELIDVTAPYALTPAGKAFIVRHKINAAALDRKVAGYQAGLEKRQGQIPGELDKTRKTLDDTRTARSTLEHDKARLDQAKRAADQTRAKADAALTAETAKDHGGRVATRKALAPFRSAVRAATRDQKSAQRALSRLRYDKTRNTLTTRSADAQARLERLRAEQARIEQKLADPRRALEDDTIEGWRKKLQIMLHEYDASIPAP